MLTTMGCGIEEDDGNDGVVASVIKVMDRSDRLGVGSLNAGRQAPDADFSVLLA